MQSKSSPLDDLKSDDLFETFTIKIFSQSHFSQTFGGNADFPPIAKVIDGTKRVVNSFDELENDQVYVALSRVGLTLRVESVENYILRQNSDFEKVVRQYVGSVMISYLSNHRGAGQQSGAQNLLPKY